MKNGFGLALIGLCIATSAPAAEFKFIALGDLPYGPPAKVYPPFERLIAEINAKAPAFTLHIGDTKSGSTPCADQMLLDQKRFMNAFETAVVYTPGDNEWTDCHRLKAGRFDPIERLSFIRRTYFDRPMSLGKSPIPIERQSDLMPAHTRYVENSRFSRDGVWFVLAHVVGSNNNNRTLANVRPGNPANAAAVLEFEARNKANVAWLEDGFDKAVTAGAAAMVVAIHANIFDYGSLDKKTEKFTEGIGFSRFGELLVRRAAEYEKPVLLIFGDSHNFRIFHPFPRRAPNVTALEVYGAAHMHAVEVSVDTNEDAVFGFKSIFNPALKSGK